MFIHRPFRLFGAVLATGAAALLPPTEASAQTFRVTSGVTSVVINPALIESAAGLSLTGANPTATSALTAPSGFAAVGFSITPTTTFQFTVGSGFTPVSGTIEHSGTVSFATTRGSLGVGTAVTIGSFSIGFDPARISAGTDGRSGFFVRDTFSNLGILFDLSNPSIVNFNTGSGALTLGGTNLLVSAEFSSFLVNNGLALGSIAGANVGFAQTNANAVPEPGTLALAAFGAAGALAWARRRRAAQIGFAG
ncbi:MAG: PEP-CTERM sorting domain-containing protein [Verrucomicrobia bacterium]|nr:PEP-CTERM sorting domain-containing protein [Verrucomicrobiota bacterium]